MMRFLSLPMHRMFYGSVFAALLAFGGVARESCASEDFRFYHENILGTSLEMSVQADDEAAAQRAEQQALKTIARLNAVFSSYDPQSELSRWSAQRGKTLRISPELMDVLKACDAKSRVSGGVFEPRVQALFALWTQAAKTGRMPEDAAISRIVAGFSQPAWRLDPAEGTAVCLTDLPITLNAIAKGYIVDRACLETLAPEKGVHGLMVSIGGDLRVCGDLTRRIGIADPRHESLSTEPLTSIALHNRALATSGGYQRGWSINGNWYSHIIDPRNGRPTGATRGASVIAETACEADALATILCVLPAVEGRTLIESLPGTNTACLIVGDDGSVTRSGNWPTAVAANPQIRPAAFTRPAPAAAADGNWDPNFEVLVKFEINAPPNAGGGYRRPYVSVWIEDKDGVPVRTLVLWLKKNGVRWFPDLRRWYRADQVRKLVDDTDLIATVSRATRPAGKYQTIWDGKDDQGRTLDAGKYTLSIEAAREHGTYQIIRQELTLENTPFVEELKGNVEIKSASVEYRRKPKSP